MKALSLFSGGLDSMIAIKLMKLQNIEVTALHMNIGFGSTKDISDKLEKRANGLGADFQMIEVKEEYIKKILFSPKYGYGKHFNPCIDCHGFMFKTAISLLDEFDASFVISGEVLGQRPMSQRLQALKSVSKLALNENNIILRPLSAKLMEPTLPEIKGWVDREKLLDIGGRGRTKQLELAKEFGFTEFDSPSGGCLLTYDYFANKIKDFTKHSNLEAQDIDLLKFGRHLRLPNGAKVVIGRNQEDNDNLRKIQNSKFDFVNFIDDIVGPVSLIAKNANEEDKILACRLILSYARTNKNFEYKVKIGDEIFSQQPFSSKDVAQKYLI